MLETVTEESVMTNLSLPLASLFPLLTAAVPDPEAQISKSAVDAGGRVFLELRAPIDRQTLDRFGATQLQKIPWLEGSMVTLQALDFDPSTGLHSEVVRSTYERSVHYKHFVRAMRQGVYDARTGFLRGGGFARTLSMSLADQGLADDSAPPQTLICRVGSKALRIQLMFSASQHRFFFGDRTIGVGARGGQRIATATTQDISEFVLGRTGTLDWTTVELEAPLAWISSPIGLNRERIVVSFGDGTAKQVFVFKAKGNVATLAPTSSRFVTTDHGLVGVNSNGLMVIRRDGTQREIHILDPNSDEAEAYRNHLPLMDYAVAHGTDSLS